jgi:hypothetical protein
MGKSSGKTSWRGGSGKPSRSRPKPVRGWQNPGAAGQTDGAATVGVNWLQSAGSLAAVVVCIALIYWLLILPGCTNARLIAVGISSYNSAALSPNAFASRDADAFARLDAPPRISVENSQGQIDFARQFADVPQQDALIVYLNLYGSRTAVGRQNPESYLLVGDADPDSATGLVPLTALWDALKAQPADQRKLVLLNLTGMQCDWRHGIFENYVLDGLEQDVADIPRLVVMCSSFPGEQSWSSGHLGDDEQGQSVFGYFVFRGLNGEADANGNGRVSVRELFEFVHRRTNNWVVQNRDPRGQHPMSIPPADSLDKLRDFDVVSVSSPAAPPVTGSSPTHDVWQRVDAAWRKRDELRMPPGDTLPPYHLDPLRWRTLTYQLMQAEQRLRAREVEPARQLLNEVDRMLHTLEGLTTSRVIPANHRQPFVYNNIWRRVLGETPAAGDAGDPLHLDRPEVHLRKMAQKDLPRDETRRQIDRAVKIRELAEQAASGPLGTAPWVWELVKKGDGHRRRAEDLLFLGQREEAEAEFQKAQNDYDQAIQAAQVIGGARSIQYRLLAELPDLAVWAARRTPPKKDAHNSRRNILEQFQRLVAQNGQPPSHSELSRFEAVSEESSDLHEIEVELVYLFESARDLQQRLEPGHATASSDDINRLQTDSQAALDRLDGVQRRLNEHADRLDDSNQPEDWKPLDDILQYALLKAPVRKKLRDRLDSLSGSLHKNTDDVAVDKMAISERPDGESDGVDGLWQAFWAIQVLSLGTEDESASWSLWSEWKDVGDMGRAPPDRVRDRLVQLGASVRESWRRKRDRINRLLKEGRETTDPQFAALALERADRMARAVHGYDAEKLFNIVDPSGKWRAYQLADLTLRHADRYLEDFWAGLDPLKDSPWYVDATEQCLDAAREIDIPSLAGRLTDVKELLKARANKEQTFFEIGQVFDIAFGTERHKQIPLEIKRKGSLPEGVAAVWLQPSGEDLMQLELERGRKQASVKAAAEAAVEKVSFDIDKLPDFDEDACRRRQQSSDSDGVKLQLLPQLLFRGHRCAKNTVVRVSPCRPEGIVVQHQVPSSTGEVVVRGSDSRSIVFILDCSLSMNRPAGGAAGGKNMFDTAVDELRNTLKNLNAAVVNDKEDIRVGLMAYGHRVRLLSDQTVLKNPNWPQDDIPAALWAQPSGVLLDYQMLDAIQLLDNAHFEEITGSLGRLAYWGNTPLVGSIDRACAELDRLGKSGTVVAITDGEAQDNAVVERLVRRIKDMKGAGRTVELQLVGFGLVGQDKVGIQQLTRDLAADVPTRLQLAPDGQELAKALKEAIDPRPYEVRRLGIRGEDRGEGGVKQRLGMPVSGLQAGLYKLQFPERDPFDFQISGDERLVFDLDSRRFRHAWEDTHRGKIYGLQKVAPSADEYKLGYRKFHVTRDNIAEFELLLIHEDDRRIVPRPAEVHFEISPKEDRSPRSMNWRLISGTSVPTWVVEVQNWPVGRQAEIRTWFKMKRTDHERDLSPEWNGSPDSQPFRLPTWPDGPQLKLVTAQFDPQERKAVVAVQAADGRPDGPEELFNLRIELGRQPNPAREVEPLSLSQTRQFFADEAKLVVEFDLFDVERRHLDGQDWNPSEWKILVTSWNALKRDSHNIDKEPLQVTRETTAN